MRFPCNGWFDIVFHILRCCTRKWFYSTEIFFKGLITLINIGRQRLGYISNNKVANYSFLFSFFGKRYVIFYLSEWWRALSINCSFASFSGVLEHLWIFCKRFSIIICFWSVFLNFFSMFIQCRYQMIGVIIPSESQVISQNLCISSYLLQRKDLQLI